MKAEISESDFIEAFKDYNRENNFSYEGKKALYNYLIDLEEDTGEEIKLDIISLCCDYEEYKNLEEYLNNYYTTEEINEVIRNFLKEFLEENDEYTKENYNEEDFKEWIKEKLEEEINNKTTLIKLGDDLDEGFIIQQY